MSRVTLTLNPPPGPVPANWKWQRIDVVATELRERAGERHQLPVLSVTKHRGIVRADEYFKKAVHGRDTANYKVVRRGQFAYATIHLNEGSIGLLTEEPAGIVSPMYTVFQPNSEVEWGYLLSLLKAPEALRVYGCLAEGTVNRRASIGFDALGKLHLLLPPPPEQRKIAVILSSVDEVIKKTEGVIEQLQVVKKAMMQELLTRGLPGRHMRFKKTEIGEIPEEWEVARIASLCSPERSSLVNGPFGSDLLKSELRSSGAPVIYIRDIRDGFYSRVSDAYVSEEKFLELASFRVTSGDVLIAKVGDPPGTTAIYPEREPDGIVTQDVVRLRPNRSKADGCFLRWYLNSPIGIDEIAAITIEGTRKRFSLGAFKKEFRVALPPVKEQALISERIEAVQKRIESESKYADDLRMVKSALLPVLLTGELRVTPEEGAA